MLVVNTLCKNIFLIFLANFLCFPCLEKWTFKFPVFPVPWQPWRNNNVSFKKNDDTLPLNVYPPRWNLSTAELTDYDVEVSLKRPQQFWENNFTLRVLPVECRNKTTGARCKLGSCGLLMSMSRCWDHDYSRARTRGIAPTTQTKNTGGLAGS